MRYTGRHKAMRPALAATVAAGLLCAFSSASALRSDDDTLIEGAKLCTRYLPRHEREYGIPEHLLAAIASTESGRYHHALGLNLPWPWTINVEGVGHFYDTKEEAIAAVRSYQERGIMSIDVGCMQVNLMHHPHAFATLDQAFEPAYNVAYAAQFLKQNFEEEGSWRKATADYHSRTLTYGEPYAGLVYGAWSRIINKVADARAGKPILSATPRPSYASAHYVRTYHPMHLHDISLAHDHDSTRENGVLVVRPEYASQSAGVQQASLDDNFVTNAHIADPTAASPERSAIAPDGGGPQIVKIRSDGNVTPKGQFEPSSHVVRSGTTEAPSDSGLSSSAMGADESAPKSPFVFNN